MHIRYRYYITPMENTMHIAPVIGFCPIQDVPDAKTIGYHDIPFVWQEYLSACELTPEDVLIFSTKFPRCGTLYMCCDKNSIIPPITDITRLEEGDFISLLQGEERNLISYFESQADFRQYLETTRNA